MQSDSSKDLDIWNDHFSWEFVEMQVTCLKLMSLLLF